MSKRLDTIFDAQQLLMKAPRTVLELCDLVGKDENSMRTIVSAMHRNGLLYRHGLRRIEGRHGKHPVVYAWQPSPFQNPDAV